MEQSYKYNELRQHEITGKVGTGARLHDGTARHFAGESGNSSLRAVVWAAPGQEVSEHNYTTFFSACLTLMNGTREQQIATIQHFEWSGGVFLLLDKDILLLPSQSWTRCLLFSRGGK